MNPHALHPDALLDEHRRRVDERLNAAARRDAARRARSRPGVGPSLFRWLGDTRPLPALVRMRRRRTSGSPVGVVAEPPHPLHEASNPTAGSRTIATCDCAANRAA